MTLIELVIVIAISSIIAVGMAVFIARPMEALGRKPGPKQPLPPCSPIFAA